VDLTKLLTAFAALVIAPIGGALLMGIDRKITARIQGRMGPPIIQPFYDVLKLFSKDAVALNRFQVLYVFMHLAFMLLVVVLLATGQDILMALFAHAFSTISLALGGMSVRSPYSRIGSQRKIMQMLAYEPILALMVVGIYMTTGSFMASDIAQFNKPLLLQLPLIFLAYFVAMLIKLEKSPFDVASSHHAHQELVKGVTLEFAGPYLGVIELTHFTETFILFAVVAAFWSTNIFIGMGIAAVCFIGQIFIDNAFARLTSIWMVKFMWTGPLLLAVGNIVWLYV
jgi:ech hydrogenase subunit B